LPQYVADETDLMPALIHEADIGNATGFSLLRFSLFRFSGFLVRLVAMMMVVLRWGGRRPACRQEDVERCD
jgi:hypothetical protein